MALASHHAWYRISVACLEEKKLQKEISSTQLGMFATQYFNSRTVVALQLNRIRHNPTETPPPSPSSSASSVSTPTHIRVITRFLYKVPVWVCSALLCYVELHLQRSNRSSRQQRSNRTPIPLMAVPLSKQGPARPNPIRSHPEWGDTSRFE